MWHRRRHGRSLNTVSKWGVWRVGPGDPGTVSPPWLHGCVHTFVQKTAACGLQASCPEGRSGKEDSMGPNVMGRGSCGAHWGGGCGPRAPRQVGLCLLFSSGSQFPALSLSSCIHRVGTVVSALPAVLVGIRGGMWSPFLEDYCGKMPVRPVLGIQVSFERGLEDMMESQSS